MRVVVAGKTYTSPLLIGSEGWAEPPAGEVRVVARHGGRILTFNDCSANVQHVRDMQTGKLTIYSPENVQILEAPVITLTQTTEGPGTLTVAKVEGEPGVWTVTNRAFTTATVNGKIRIMVNGKP